MKNTIIASFLLLMSTTVFAQGKYYLSYEVSDNKWDTGVTVVSGATLDEVAYQLGHSPGSPMTRRYARFLESAQRGIADRTQRVMDEMLN